MRKVIAFLVLATLAGSGLAVAREFGEETSVVVVEVPVQVTRDGEPVRGLTASDFEVYDGRKEQDLVGFDVVDLSVTQPTASVGGAAMATPQMPIAGRRHFLLMFDLSFSDPRNVLRARDAALDLVRQGLHPTDLVAVASYTNSRGPALALGFTSDRRQIEFAIEGLGLPEVLPQSLDAAALAFGGLQDALASQTSGGTAPSGPGGQGPGGLSSLQGEIQAHLQDVTRGADRQDRDFRRNQIVAFTRAFAALADMMSSVRGRKYVVFLSEGFDSSLLFASTNLQEQRDMNQAAEAGEVWKIDSDQRFGSTRAQSVIDDMVESFRRADCVIESVDIGGLRAGGGASAGAISSDTATSRGQDGLFAIADATGGEMIRNFNDLSSAMSEVLERTSVTYVLAFQPRNLTMDGKYHRIKVKLRNEPRGTHLVHRPGYYAPKPFGERSALEKRLITAEEIMGGAAGGSIQTTVLAAPFYSGGASAFVPVVIEIDGNDLLEGNSGDVLPTEIYAYGIDTQGQIRDFFSQLLPIDLSKSRDGLRKKGLKYYGHLDLPPDDYTLRVLIRNPESGRQSMRVMPLEVPDFNALPGPTLLPPFFPEASGTWLLAREQKPSSGEEFYPFVVSDQAFIPAAKPVLHSGETAQMALMAYNLSSGPVSVDAQVFTPDGRAVEGGAIQLMGDAAAGGSGFDRLLAGFQPRGLPQGEYTLVVGLTPQGSSERVHASTDFVVQ